MALMLGALARHDRGMFRLAFLSVHIEDSPEARPLGAASVAAALLASTRPEAPHLSGKLEVSLVEGFVSEAASALADRLLASDPDWVGLSVYSWNRGRVAQVASLLRERKPEILLFAGGPEATADPEGLLQAAPLDFLARGEGEASVLAALELLAGGAPVDALAGIKGLALPGRVAASCRAPALDLSLLPSPWLAGLIDPKEGVLWELARGCPFHCAYCYEGKGEAGVRRFPQDRVEAELDYFAKSGAEQVFVLDPTFDADRERARSILALIEKKAPDIAWKFEVRAEFIDRDLARRFARLDASVQIGLQSADPEVSALVGRSLDPKDFARRVGYLNAAGAVFGFDLIYGLPGDDFDGFAKSVDFALELQPNHLDVFPLSLLPGTELADRAVELGLVAQTEPPYTILSAPGFTPAGMERAEALAGACEVFYSRGRAVSWFLQAARPLKAKPHAILERFASWMAAQGVKRQDATLDSHSIESAQLAFLREEYERRGISDLYPALCDIVRFNAAWGRAIAEGESSQIELSYDPDDVLGPEALDLARFAREARPSPEAYTVDPGPSGPRMKKSRRDRHGVGNGPYRGRRIDR
jgi:hypothetical protein